MITFPNAKINLGLNIVEKRADGFHNIESVFYPVGLRDILEVVESDREGIEFAPSGIPIPGKPEENLCVRAYHMVRRDYELPGIRVHLHKIIPIGAGLGGGSSDASFFIKLLNDQFGLWIAWGEIHEYARRLGSDCSFFISNKPSFVTQRGDDFENIQLDLSGYHLVIVYPNIHVDTKEAFHLIRPQQASRSLADDVLSLPPGEWKGKVKNDFEESVFRKYPAIAGVKEKLYSLGALYASLSGSGSAVYGIFSHKTDLRKEFSGYFTWEGGL
ncbi:MAG: 4-(cytidine 5'-diphospho)-2-C-methyl-D-erythritol kinase [Bacteroidota bacterium]